MLRPTTKPPSASRTEGISGKSTNKKTRKAGTARCSVSIFNIALLKAHVKLFLWTRLNRGSEKNYCVPPKFLILFCVVLVATSPAATIKTPMLGDQMDRHITISTTEPALHMFLMVDLPEGVKIISKPPTQRRSIDWNVSFNVNITLAIDLTTITIPALAIWLFTHIRRQRREIEAKINGKQFPIDQSEAIEFIAKEIEHKQKNQNDKN